MAPSTIRKAIGVVKDQTSISLAKVSSNIAPDLDVAIVKATSHENEPADEKYIREIVNLTAYSRGYVGACVAAVSRRLGKTRDWIVALKTLMLVHRLLAEGDPVFHHELLYATRRGARVLNISDFCDEAHSSSWDHSAFVRTYALYLDQRLSCFFHDRNSAGDGGSRSSLAPYQHSDFVNHGPSSGDNYGRNPNEDKRPATPLAEMKPDQVLGRMRQLQQLLDRLLSCRPTGLAKDSRMVLVALFPIVRESFQLYADICEILAVLLDRYFEMEYSDCIKAFEAYCCAAKQFDELAAFYGWCKNTGVARSSEYPAVQPISDKLLETLEEFMRDRATVPKTLARCEEVVVLEEEPPQDMNSIKALPAPLDCEEQQVREEAKLDDVLPKVHPQPQGDLVDLRDDEVTANTHGNKLALALFSSGAVDEGKETWHTLSSFQDSPVAEDGKADWELALVETASKLANQKANLGGGFDTLLLNGMYDHGAVRHHVRAQAIAGSASSVVLPDTGKKAVPVLALPGSIYNMGGDPFAASLTIPPPSYVQMSDMEKKQRLLMQEQQLWQQYSNGGGMQGQGSFANLNNGYSYPNLAMQYGIPQIAAYYYPNM